MASFGRRYLVELADGAGLDCVTRGKRGALACGDRVTVARTAAGRGVIEAVGARSTLLYRSDRARQKLPSLRKEFNAGLQPGEHLLLKAPFETSSGGREWMWVEVSSWKGDDIVGLLANEPEDVKGLRAGSTVKVSEKEVFDYIRYKADGSSEGNETGKEIEKVRTR